jgi:hypothetical protein
MTKTPRLQEEKRREEKRREEKRREEKRKDDKSSTTRADSNAALRQEETPRRAFEHGATTL